MKPFLILCSVTLLPWLAGAYLHQGWPYPKLSEEADLIVIATPNSFKDTGEKSTLPGIKPELTVIKVETTFDCLAVIKGDKNLKQVVLTHYRENPPTLVDRGGPSLLSFDPKSKKQFILFLKKDTGNRFVPVAGQTDPGDSVKEIISPR